MRLRQDRKRTRKEKQFLEINRDLLPKERLWSEPRRWQPDIVEEGGRLKLILRLEDDIKTEDLQKAMPVVTLWRDRLEKFQGAIVTLDFKNFHDPTGGRRRQFLNDLAARYPNESYAALARSVNKMISNAFCEGDYPAALDTMRMMGMKERKVQEQLDIYCDKLKQEESLYSEDEPFDKQSIVDALKPYLRSPRRGGKTS